MTTDDDRPIRAAPSRPTPGRGAARDSQGRGPAAILLVLAVAVLAAGCGLPRDPEGTLARARGGELHVGVAHDPPWAVVEDGEVVGGVEVALAREFAARIDAEPVFHPGAVDALASALERFELDLVIGGFVADSPWAGRVAFSDPFHREEIVVATAEPSGRRDDLDGEVVLYPADRRALAAAIRSEGGTPVATDDIAAQASSGVLVAVPIWALTRFGVATVGVELERREHVIAVPPGENALLLELETYLTAARGEIRRLLAESVP